jgi:hypothetical protein
VPWNLPPEPDASALVLRGAESVRIGSTGVDRRCSPASSSRHRLTTLLAELGINDPAHSVFDGLAGAASEWTSIADLLSALSLDFTDPTAILLFCLSSGEGEATLAEAEVRVEVRLATDEAGEIYILTKSDGLIRRVVSIR